VLPKKIMSSNSKDNNGGDEAYDAFVNQMIDDYDFYPKQEAEAPPPSKKSVRFNRGALISGTRTTPEPEVKQSFVKGGRAALIGGGPKVVEEEEEDYDDDMESGILPPESDYASVVPQALLDSVAASRQFYGNPVTADDIQRDYSIISSDRGPSAIAQQVQESGKERDNKRKKFLYVLSGVSVLLIAAIIAVSVLVFGKKDPEATIQPTVAPTASPTLQPVMTREQVLDDFITKVTGKVELQDEESPQSLARKWLVEDDDLWSSLEKVPSDYERVIQRYALAVFYYATNGHIAWGLSDDTSWLDGDECSGDFWFGLDCNAQDQVRTIAFGKFTSQFSPFCRYLT
jgi:hypothetical protein